MEKLLELLFDLVLFMIYGGAITVIAFIIQLIGYRVFNFNIYKFLKYNLAEKEMVKWNKN